MSQAQPFSACGDQRSENALVGALAEMYVQGVSTRKVKTITEDLARTQLEGEAEAT